MSATDDEVASASVESLVGRCLRTKEPRGCLGLPASAPREACRKRYLQLALRLHPDKTAHARAGEAFRAVEDAFRAIERQAQG